ncbi:MAG: hypothetical protein AB8G22_23405 [Saprospiraceae bacterium]
MQDSKFFQLFKTLDKPERRAFFTYMQQRFPKDTAPFLLFERFHKMGHKFSGKKMAITYLQQHLLKEEVTAKRISNEASKVYRALEDFLLEQHLRTENKATLRSLLLVDIFRERNVEKLVEKKNTVFQEAQSKQKDSFWYNLRAYQHSFATYHAAPNKTDKEIQLELNQQHIALDNFYLIHRLKSCCEQLSQAIIFGKETKTIDKKIEQLNEIAHTLRTTPPLFTFYQLAYRLIASPSEENYFHFLQQVHPQQPFDANDLHAGLFYVINNNAKLIRSNPYLGMERCVELFQLGKENNWLQQRDYVSEKTLHNAINVGCGLYKTDWSQQFLDAIYPKLEPNCQELARKIAQARIDFALEKYEKVANDLLDLSFTDNYHIIQAKVLQLRSYFELNHQVEYAEPQQNLKHSFRRYLKRNKLFSPDRITSYIRFLEIYDQLELRKLRFEEIQLNLKNDNIACKNWLQEKLKSYSPDKWRATF